jgi:hypothetical protein
VSAPAPPPLDGLAASILERALERIERMRQELKGIAHSYAERDDLPGTQASLRALQLIVGETEREIVAAGRNRASEIGTEAAFRKTVASHLRTLESLLRDQLASVQRTHKRDLEPLVPPLTRMASVIGPEQHLIFDPVDRYEIELSDDRRWLTKYASHFSSDLLDALKALPTVSVLSFPALMEGETLQHLLFGHEMGHLALAKVLGDTEIRLGDAAFFESLSDNFEALSKEIGEGSSERETYKKQRQTLDRLEQWFAELACDQIGIRLVGPAFLLALHDFAALRDAWAQKKGIPGYETHPGLAWRLERLLPEARRFLDNKRQTRPWKSARETVARIEGEIPSERDEITPIEMKVITDALDALEQHLGDDQLEEQLIVGDFERLFDVVWEKLENGIPPAEEILMRSRPDTPLWRRRRRRRNPSEAPPDPWSQPMDWRVILNGGYFFWFGTVDKITLSGHLPIDPRRIKNRADLNTKLRGSIELSEMQLKLQEVKEKLDVMNEPREED